MRMPPSTAMMTKLPDWSQRSARGSTKLLSSAKSVPATLTNKQEITNDIQIWRLDRDAEEARAALVLADRQQACGRTASAAATPWPRRRRANTTSSEIVERLVVAEDVEVGEAEIDRHAVPAA